MRTRTDFEKLFPNPRIPTAQVLESICATSTPGTRRRTSGMLVAPDRRISSCVRTISGDREPPASLRSFAWSRSEEHTSELQSRQYLVCRLLLEKKKHL